MFKKKPKRKRQQYGSEYSESEESEAEGNNLSKQKRGKCSKNTVTYFFRPGSTTIITKKII